MDESKPILAHKDDKGKLRFDLLPPYPMSEVALNATIGAGKYGDRNWEGGMAWGRILGAIHRHINQWERGQDRDKEGFHHLAAAAYNLLMLIEFQRTGAGVDNTGRKKGDLAKDLAERIRREVAAEELDPIPDTPLKAAAEKLGSEPGLFQEVVPSSKDVALNLVFGAMARSFAKHGPLTRDYLRANTILGEEVGEVCRALLDLTRAAQEKGKIPSSARVSLLPDPALKEKTISELSQVASTAILMIMNLIEDKEI